MHETPVSFINAMEGVALAEKRRSDLATFTAWHTAVFAIQGYQGKLKPFSDYLGRGRGAKVESEAMQNARAIHFFNALKARGVPIKVERVTRH